MSAIPGNAFSEYDELIDHDTDVSALVRHLQRLEASQVPAQREEPRYVAEVKRLGLAIYALT